MIFRRFLALFLSFSLIFSSTSALAASPAGWSASASDAVISGATATITAFKGSGANAVKAVVAHKPTAVAVGKELIKGGGLVALAYAASQLLGAGVDWVLDPENNRIKYTSVNADGTVDGTCSGTGWYAYGYENLGFYSTGQGACNALAASRGLSSGVFTSSDNKCVAGGGKVLSKTGVCDASNPTFVPTTGEQYLPIDTVAAQVISNAEAGHVESQDFVKAVAVGQANAGDLDTALEAVAEPTTDTPTDTPADPTKPFDDSGILAALKKILAMLGLLSLLGTISDSLSGLLDWVKGDPETKPEDTELEIDVPDIAPANTDINFGGQCPAPFVFQGAIFGNPIKIQLLDTAMFCDFLATYVKWPVYAASTLYALYLIGGRKDE